MSTHSLAGDKPKLSIQDERAIKAVRNFRQLQPTLTSFARVMTGNKKVRVEMSASSNGMTDGLRIFYRPPVELGDLTEHNRRLCDKRDSELQLLCDACRIRESVLITIYHEIAHIAEDSFAPTTEHQRIAAVKRAVEESGNYYAEKIKERLDRADYRIKSSYLGLAGLISPFLPMIVNGLEDARVNRRLFEARKGTKVMFQSEVNRVLKQGFETANPYGGVNQLFWRDAPLNTQVPPSLFVKASGYDYKGAFHPVIEQMLDDPVISELTSKVSEAKNASDTYELAFPVLARLRELGLCQAKSDPEPEPEPEPEKQGTDSDDSNEHDSEPSSGSQDSGNPDEESGAEKGDDDNEANSSSSSDSDGTSASDESGREQDSDGDEQGDSEASTDAAAGESEDSLGSGDELEDASDESTSGEDANQDDAGADESSEPEGGSSDRPEGQSEEGSSDDDSESADGSAGKSASSMETGEDEGSSDEEQVSEGDLNGDSKQETGVSDADEGSSRSGESVPDADSSDSDETPESTGHEDDGDSGQLGEDEPERHDSDADEGDSNVEAIDSGADEGLGGVKLNIPEGVELGDEGDGMDALLQMQQGHSPAHRPTEVDLSQERALDIAVVQGLYFETPSTEVTSVAEYVYDSDDPGPSWSRSKDLSKADRIRLGIDGDFDIPESILGPALRDLRRVFSDNKRGHDTLHLKSGKINARVLGKRAPAGDPRLFKRRIQPGKKDYFVLIGVDVSGSTRGLNLLIEKRAVKAQAELLARLGVPFAIYAHSGQGSYSTGAGYGTEMSIYKIKEPDEVWNDKTRTRLEEITHSAVNLDGHTLEYYRKVLDRQMATDRIILYYTDGKMPAENYEEELEILQREIKICRQKNYTLLGVGIRTDSPIRHGLDTVQVDEIEDVPRVVSHLEKRLLKG